MEPIGNKNPPEALMTPEEAAAYLKVAPGTVRQWVKLGRIPFIKVRSLTRFRRSDLDAWLGEPVEKGAA